MIIGAEDNDDVGNNYSLFEDYGNSSKVCCKFFDIQTPLKLRNDKTWDFLR